MNKEQKIKDYVKEILKKDSFNEILYLEKIFIDDQIRDIKYIEKNNSIILALRKNGTIGILNTINK